MVYAILITSLAATLVETAHGIYKSFDVNSTLETQGMSKAFDRV